MRKSKLSYLIASFAAFEVAAEPQAIRDTTRPLVPMSQYTPPNDLDNDPNFFYPSEYRVLNCWECFEAQGKICIDEGHNSLYHHTGSSDKGNAFCCKPDSTDEYCKTGNVHKHGETEDGITTLCSPPSTSTTAYSAVLTQRRNHQLFAFCPSISHQRCGISSSTGSSTDMQLKAGIERKVVYSNTMKYKKPAPSDTSSDYDACYYEISLDESILKEYNPKSLKLEFSSKKNMNVFVYSGSARTDSKESVIQGNLQAQIGQTYSIGVSKGFLIVAYPDQDTQTEFGFEIWAEAVLKSEDTTEAVAVPVVVVNDSGSGKIVIEKQNEDGETSRSTIIPGQENDLLFYGLCGAAGLLLISIVFICIKCRKKGKITNASQLNNLTDERSLHLEDIDQEDFKDNTGRPSLPKQIGAVFSNDNDKLPMAASYKQVAEP